MPRPLTAERLAAMVADINRQWDDVDRECDIIARDPIIDYRPHNGVPRCITVPCPWMIERRPDGWWLVNVHTLQSARLREAPEAAPKAPAPRRPSRVGGPRHSTWNDHGEEVIGYELAPGMDARPVRSAVVINDSGLPMVLIPWGSEAESLLCGAAS